jgi:FMN phosphatase YigB (HAD superfamily)
MSCYLHQLKPEQETFDSMIRHADLIPERTMFIDDTLKNVGDAMWWGIHGFHMDSFFV